MALFDGLIKICFGQRCVGLNIFIILVDCFNEFFALKESVELSVEFEVGCIDCTFELAHGTLKSLHLLVDMLELVLCGDVRKKSPIILELTERAVLDIIKFVHDGVFDCVQLSVESESRIVHDWLESAPRVCCDHFFENSEDLGLGIDLFLNTFLLSLPLHGVEEGD